MKAQDSLAKLGITLPPPPPPGGLYKPVVIVGDLAYVSGHGPYRGEADGYLTGRVGDDFDLGEAQEAARLTGLSLLATIEKELGSINRVKRLIKTLALVNSTPDFTDQPAVINGFSELFRDIFGEDGVGARSALGTNVLPGNIPVEIELILEID